MGPPVAVYMAGSLALVGSGCLFKKHVFDLHLEPWIAARKEGWKQEAASQLHRATQSAQRQLEILAQGAQGHLQELAHGTQHHAEALARNAQGCLEGIAKGTQEQLGAAKQGAERGIQAMVYTASGAVVGLTKGAVNQLERVQIDLRCRGERAGFIPIHATPVSAGSSRRRCSDDSDDRPMGWDGRSDTPRTDLLFSMETADGSEMIFGRSPLSDATPLLNVVEIKDVSARSTGVEVSTGELSRRHASPGGTIDRVSTPIERSTAHTVQVPAGGGHQQTRSPLQDEMASSTSLQAEMEAGFDLDQTPMPAGAEWTHMPSFPTQGSAQGSQRDHATRADIFRELSSTPVISLIDLYGDHSGQLQDQEVFSALTSPQAMAPDLVTLDAHDDGASLAFSSSEDDSDFDLVSTSGSERPLTAPFSPASALGFSMIFPLEPRTLALTRTSTNGSAIDRVTFASPSSGSVISLADTAAPYHEDAFSESSDGWSEARANV